MRMNRLLSADPRGSQHRPRVTALRVAAARAMPIIFIGLLALLAAVVASRIAGFTADDFFITYRYAQNLVAGRGFVFNPGERVFGTTAPGWGLLLAGLSWLSGLEVAVVGTWAMAVSLTAVVSLLWRRALGQRRGTEAAVAGVLLLTNTYLWVFNGSESFPQLALLVLAAGLAARRPRAAGALAGLCVWLRPDALAAVVLLGALLWFRSRRTPLGFGLAAGAMIIAGLVWAQLYFGQPLPQTLAAKRLQAAWRPEIWSSGWRFWVAGYRALALSYAGPWTAVLLVVGLAGTRSLLAARIAGLDLLVLYALATAIAYPFLGVPFYSWYALPLLIVLSYGVVFLAGDAIRWLARGRPGQRTLRWVATVGIAVVLAPLLLHVSRGFVRGYRHFAGIAQTEVYRRAGAWLRANTPPEEAIAYIEVGTLAYVSDRPVRDLLCLTSRNCLAPLVRGGVRAAFEAEPTPWIAYHSRLSGLLAPLRQAPWFANYQAMATFDEPQGGRMILYHHRKATP